jgi:hypothetical protein
MATKLVNFARAFTLTLGRGPGETIPFQAGVQQVDEALLDHWYVQANMVGAKQQPPKIGSKAYADADAAAAAQIENLRQIADTAAQNLADLRAKAKKSDIDEMVARLQPKTPINEVTAAAKRQIQEHEQILKGRGGSETVARTQIQAALPDDKEDAETHLAKAVDANTAEAAAHDTPYPTAKAPDDDSMSGFNRLIQENTGVDVTGRARAAVLTTHDEVTKGNAATDADVNAAKDTKNTGAGQAKAPVKQSMSLNPASGVSKAGATIHPAPGANDQIKADEAAIVRDQQNLVRDTTAAGAARRATIQN